MSGAVKVFVAAFLPLVIAYWPTLQWIVASWFLPDSYYSHGPLVPIVALVVVLLRRRQWAAAPARYDRLGFVLLAPGLLLHLAGALLTIDSLSAVSLVLTVPGAAWTVLGRERLRPLWPVLGLVVFAIPLPMFVSGRLAFELKELAIDAGTDLANLLGVAVVRRGADLVVPGQELPLVVADACGGLRSLVALVTLAWCLAFFMGPSGWLRRGVLLAAAVPIAMLVNVLRIAAICWLALHHGTPYASGAGHDLANAGAWVVALLLLLGIDHVVTRLWPPSPAPARPLPAAAGTRSGAAPVAVVLWLLAPFLLWLSLTRPEPSGVRRAPLVPAVAGGFAVAEEIAMTPRHHELLGTTDAAWRRYREIGADGAAAGDVWVVAVFHDANWKSIHPPHICIEGSNMTIRGDDRIAATVAGRPIEVGRILARSRDNGREYLSLYVFGAEGFVSGSYGEFVLHHLPSALLRRTQSGYLLRVETFVGEGGATAAQARCLTLLQALVPALEATL